MDCVGKQEVPPAVEQLSSYGGGGPVRNRWTGGGGFGGGGRNGGFGGSFGSGANATPTQNMRTFPPAGGSFGGSRPGNVYAVILQTDDDC